MMPALLATIVTATNCLFVTVPPWSPTNAPAEWVACGNWRGGVRAGAEFTRLAETNAAAVFSCVDGYYERAEVARVPFGSSVVDDFPSQRHWRTNDVRYAASVRGAEWAKPPRAITNSIRLLSWADTVSVASNLVGSAVESRPTVGGQYSTGLYHAGLMRRFGSPWLDAAVRVPSFATNGQWAIVMPHTLGGVYPPSFSTGDAYETAMEWRDCWPTWGRCAFGDAVYADATNGLSGAWRYYDCDQQYGFGETVPNEAPWVTLFRMPDEWGVLETYAAERNGWTLARAASSVLPLGGVPVDPAAFRFSPFLPHVSTNGVTATDAMMGYCNLATNVMPHVTNATLRLDRERQGAINVCEAACRYTYAVADASGYWLGLARSCRSQTHYDPYGKATITVTVDDFTGEVTAEVDRSRSYLFFVPVAITNDFDVSPAVRTHGPVATAEINPRFSFLGESGQVVCGAVSLFDCDSTGWMGFSDALRTYIFAAGLTPSDGDEIEAEIWSVRALPAMKGLLSSIVAVRVNGGQWVSDFAAEEATRRTLRADFSGEYEFDFADTEGFGATSLLEATDAWATNLVAASLPQGCVPTDALWQHGFVRSVRTAALQCVTSGNTNENVVVGAGRTFQPGVCADNEMRMVALSGETFARVSSNRVTLANALNAAVLTNFDARVGTLAGTSGDGKRGGMALLARYMYDPSVVVGAEDFADRLSLGCEIDERHPHIVWRGVYRADLGGFDNRDGWDLSGTYPYVTNGVCTIEGYTELASLDVRLAVDGGEYAITATSLTDRAVSVHGRQGECHRTDWRWMNLSEPKQED